MPQVEGWRVESGEQCFSSRDCFLTFGHVADTSVLACFPARFWFFRGDWGQGGKQLDVRILASCGTLGKWLQPLALWIPSTIGQF